MKRTSRATTKTKRLSRKFGKITLFLIDNSRLKCFLSHANSLSHSNSPFSHSLSFYFFFFLNQLSLSVPSLSYCLSLSLTLSVKFRLRSVHLILSLSVKHLPLNVLMCFVNALGLSYYMLLMTVVRLFFKLDKFL